MEVAGWAAAEEHQPTYIYIERERERERERVRERVRETGMERDMARIMARPTEVPIAHPMGWLAPMRCEPVSQPYQNNYLPCYIPIGYVKKEQYIKREERKSRSMQYKKYIR